MYYLFLFLTCPQSLNPGKMITYGLYSWKCLFFFFLHSCWLWPIVGNQEARYLSDALVILLCSFICIWLLFLTSKSAHWRCQWVIQSSFSNVALITDVMEGWWETADYSLENKHVSQACLYLHALLLLTTPFINLPYPLLQYEKHILRDYLLSWRVLMIQAIIVKPI